MSAQPPVPGVSRKQNVACDACRSKKVRCLRASVNETCAQCSTKGMECTSIFIEQLQQSAGQKKKRVIAKRGEKNGDGLADAGMIEQGYFGDPSRALGNLSSVLPGESSRQGFWTSTPSAIPGPASIRQSKVLRYMFAPHPVTHHEWTYTDVSSMEQCDREQSDTWEEMNGEVWREAPSGAHLAISGDEYQDLAEDLVDSFFSIVHPRFGLWDHVALHARISDPDLHPDGPVSDSILALILAWGSRYSDHNIIMDDRAEMSVRDPENATGRTRSRIVQLLVLRCREVLEANKVQRIPTLENAQLLLMSDSMLTRGFTLGRIWLTKEWPCHENGYTPYDLRAAARHIVTLGYDRPDRLALITDGRERMSAELLCLLVSLADVGKSLLHQFRPFDLENTPPKLDRSTSGNSFPIPDPGEGAAMSLPILRKLSMELWTPTTRSQGVETSLLVSFTETYAAWRDQYYESLSVPADWPAEWDFLAVINACTADVMYHVIWVTVCQAIADFGIMEEKRGIASLQTAEARRRITQEADHGALRVAALTTVLEGHGYLRLDPSKLHTPIYAAGMFLASRGREECRGCASGLKQYSISYPGFWTKAEAIEEVYRAHIRNQNTSPAHGMYQLDVPVSQTAHYPR